MSTNRALVAGLAFFMTAALALGGARFVAAADEKGPAPRENKLELKNATVHRLTDGTVKEEGVVVVQDAGRSKEMMAKAYVEALPEAKKGSPRSKRGSACCILAAGPMLDNNWQVAARSLVQRGRELELTIVLADPKRGKRETIIPMRPLVYAPLELPAGTYSLTATWELRESLPDGKPVRAKPLSHSCAFVRGDRPAPKEAKPGGSTEPKGLPLEARLIAKKIAYPLDLGGKTPKEFRTLLDEAKAKGGPLPPPPAVELVLELRNTGKKALHVCLGKGDVGPVAGLTLDLKGPGAVSASFGNARGARISPTVVEVAAGKTHTVTIAKLEVYDGRTTQRCYWTKAGDYTLAVSCGVVEGGKKGFWRAAGKVVSAPIELKVGGAKADPPKASEPVEVGDLAVTVQPTAGRYRSRDR